MILSSWTQFILFLSGVTLLLIASVPGNVQMGTFFFDSFRYEEAFRYYAEALKDDRSNLKNLKKLKAYFLLKGDTKRALDLQESLVKLRPENLDYLRELQSLYDWNRMPYEKLKAREAETNLLKPKQRISILEEVAQGYRWLQHYEDAGRVYRILAETGRSDFVFDAVTFFASIGERDEVERLSRLLPPGENAETFQRWMAELAEFEGNHPLALERYQRLLSPEGKPFETLSKKTLTSRLLYLERVNRNLLALGRGEEAEENLRRLMAVFPENLSLAYDLAYFFLERGENEKALTVFLDLEKKERSPERRFDLCSAYGSLGAEGETNRCLRSLTKGYPEIPRYLRALAESYERLGKKVEALRIYEEILRLEGELDASLYRPDTGAILLAQTETMDPQILPKKKKKRPTVSGEELDDLRLRVIYLREELGEGDRSEKLLRTLVKRHPRDLGYKRQLAYFYFDRGRRAEGMKIMEDILSIEPKDPEALRLTLGRDAEEGRRDEVLRKLELLEPLEEISLLELKFQVLSEIPEKRDELEDFCLGHGLRFKEIQLRCEFQFGKKHTAARELRGFIIEEKRDDLRPLLASWYLELENLRGLEEEIEWLKTHSKFNTEELRRALEELKELKRSRREWLLTGASTQVIQSGSRYLISEVDLLKKLEGPGVGVRLDSLQGANPFFLVSPYAYFETESAQFKLGPSFGAKDRGLSLPFFADASLVGSERLYLNFHYENSRPLFEVRELQRSSRATRRFGSVFLGYRGEGNYTEASLTKNDYEFEGEEGTDHQIFIEHLRTLSASSRWSFGLRGFLVDLSSEGEELGEVLIDEARGYYVVGQYANSFLLPRQKQWNYLFKLAVGGDLVRDIAFGEAYNARGELEYLWTEKRGLRLSVDYFKESYLARINDMSLFGVQYFINF